MKKQLAGLAFLVMFFGITGMASATVLVEKGTSWRYTVLNTDLWSEGDWDDDAGLDSADWQNALNWNLGNAAFGNVYSLPYSTEWTANTDLALQRDFTIDGSFSGPITLNVASDNGFIVFINGQQVAKANAEGYTSYWEYSLTLATDGFQSGHNLIQVLAEDHGGATFFDLQLASAPVPEPATMLLFGTGLAGLAAVSRRRKKAC